MIKISFYELIQVRLVKEITRSEQVQIALVILLSVVRLNGAKLELNKIDQPKKNAGLDRSLACHSDKLKINFKEQYEWCDPTTIIYIG